MSLYKEYLEERTDDHIYEDDQGFVTWRYLDEKQVYIIDIYVRRDFRKTGKAKDLADIVVKEAKERGCDTLVGSVVPGNTNQIAPKTATLNLKLLFDYGITLDSSTNNLIIVKKAI